MPSDVPAGQSAKSLTPEVTWAQRSSDSDAAKNFIYLTIAAADVPAKDMTLDLQPTSLSFKGYSNSKKATYEVTLEFYAEIVPAESKTNHSSRDIELKLQKKDLKEEYWPRLLKESRKMHFLHTDFDKWVDEDEQDGVADDDYMNQFGGAGGAGGGMSGMPGMGGMSGMPGMPGMDGLGGDGGFGGLDFSKLGGGGMGMPDLSGLGGAGGDDEDEDDDEMPDLEDEAEVSQGTTPRASEGTKSSGAKIEEVE